MTDAKYRPTTASALWRTWLRAAAAAVGILVLPGCQAPILRLYAGPPRSGDQVAALFIPPRAATIIDGQHCLEPRYQSPSSWKVEIEPGVHRVFVFLVAPPSGGGFQARFPADLVFETKAGHEYEIQTRLVKIELPEFVDPDECGSGPAWFARIVDRTARRATSEHDERAAVCADSSPEGMCEPEKLARMASAPRCSVEPLRSMLKSDQRPQSRAEAALALAVAGDRGAAPALIDVLKEQDARILPFAARALGLLKEPRAVEALISDLESAAWNTPDVSWALGEIGDPRAVPPLVEALKRAQWQYVEHNAKYRATIEALGKLKDPRATEVLIAALAPPEWYYASVEGLKDLCFYRAADAARALGRIRDPRAVEPLIRLMERRKGFHYRGSTAAAVSLAAAARALGKTKDPRVAPLLLQTLEEFGTPGELCLAATWGLADMNDARVLASLTQVLESGKWYGPYYAAHALGATKDPQAVEPLIAALRKTKGWYPQQVRAKAAAALGHIGGPRAIDPLIGALSDPDRHVREKALASLKHITGKDLGPKADAWQARRAGSS